MSVLGKIGIGCLNALSHLPLSAHYFFSDILLYPLVRYVVRYRVKVVRRNLAKAFPEKSETERREIERKFYHYFCDLIVETIKAHSISTEEIQRRYKFVGIENLDGAYAKHDFLCCYLSHYCNWEWAVCLPLQLAPHRAGMCQIYHPLKNKLFDQWFLENRARFGAVNIPMKQTLRRLMTLRNEMKQSGSKVRSYMFGCIADQLPKAENIHHRIQFLGQDTGVFTGSETLGKKFDMAFFYCKVTRPKRGYYQMEFLPLTTEKNSMELCNGSNVQRDGRLEPSAISFPMTDEYFRRFEQDIKERPELWLWTHDRWKR